MKLSLSTTALPRSSLLITCSSHEVRCRGVLRNCGNWSPRAAVLFHYDDDNPQRECNHELMVSDLLAASVNPIVLPFTEASAVKSLHDNMVPLRSLLAVAADAVIVLDISVFTKRHLLMMLRWLDDEGLWDRLTVVYCEPEDYDVSMYIPLSFGLASLQQIPGFSACPDLSRSVHLVLFLGYEGDRALASYEHIQPMKTSVVIPHPPFKPAWVGRTENFNTELLAMVGDGPVSRVDSIDPDATESALVAILGDVGTRDDYARIICPLGTKPQTLGIYSYVRNCADPPAVVYAGPLRHNHAFFSHGIGHAWVLKQAVNS